MVKIAITGKMRSGKDTFASPLLNRPNVVHLKFADGITDLIGEYLPELLLEGKPREAYQVIGQALRQFDGDVWVRELERQYDYAQIVADYENFPVDIIITDVRQPNEYQWCKDNGFTVVKMTCPDEVRIKRITECGDEFEPEQFYHETEGYVDTFETEVIIDSDCSKEWLHIQANMLYEILQKEEDGHGATTD